MTCPVCRSALAPSTVEDRLDQSGRTYLPARRYFCPKCPGTIGVLPTGEPYRSEEAP